MYLPTAQRLSAVFPESAYRTYQISRFRRFYNRVKYLLTYLPMIMHVLRLPTRRYNDTDDSALPSTRCAEDRRGEAPVYLSPLFVESMRASGGSSSRIQQRLCMYGRLARAHIPRLLVK